MTDKQKDLWQAINMTCATLAVLNTSYMIAFMSGTERMEEAESAKHFEMMCKLLQGLSLMNLGASMLGEIAKEIEKEG